MNFHDTSTQAHARDAAAETAYPSPSGFGRDPKTLWGSPPKIKPITDPFPFLPGADVDMSWNDGTGNCVGVDPDVFFVSRGHNDDAQHAVAICQGCPLIEPCANHGIKHELFGVWGGLTGKDRRAIRRGDRVGQPRPKTRNALQEATVSVIVHGTESGHRKHRRYPDIHGPICDDCARAQAEVNRKRKQRLTQ